MLWGTSGVTQPEIRPSTKLWCSAEVVEELRLQVVLDKELESLIEGVVAFGDFKPKGDNPFTAIYSVDGAHSFYSDLILGRPLPLVLVIRNVETMGVLLSVALFLHRELALNPAIPGMLAAVNLMDTHGVRGLAHVDRDLAKFLKFVRAYLVNYTGKVQEALGTAVGFLRSYLLEGRIPALPPEPEPPRPVHLGTDGFVFATGTHPDLFTGWEELYREGFLRGVLMHQKGEDRWHVLAARKSPYLSFDLQKAASLLNEAEAAMGEPQGWQTDEYWLQGPEDGTLILPSVLLQVFLRI